MKKGFWSWQGNNLPWVKWGTAHLIGVSIPILLMFLIWIFKSSIRKNFQNKDNLFFWVGIVTLFFFFLNRLLMIISGYPFEWEWVPFHLCRMSILLYGIFLVTKKTHLIKYVAFWSIGGSVAGLTLIDMGNIVDPTTGHVYVRSIGPDNYFWWDYFLAHGFGFVCPVFFWTVKGFKMNYKEFWISSGILLGLSFLAFFIDWIFAGYSVNYFFLGKSSSFYLPLPGGAGVIADWPWRIISYSILGIAFTHALWLFWLLQQNWFKFEEKEKGVTANV